MFKKSNLQNQQVLYDNKFSQKGVPDLLGRKYLHFGKIISLLEPKPKERILDVGCNRGDLVKEIRIVCPEAEVLGCDINADAISASDIPGLYVMHANKLEYPANSFDKIVSSHTIEHVPDVAEALEEMKRVLKPGGTCVLVYPFEIFRGSNNLFSAWRAHGNPMIARKFHLHRLNPDKIEKLTSMKIVRRGLFYGPYPTHFTVLQK